MTKNIEQFNIILTGVGGQGIITLTRILSEAALFAGLDVKTSELHGLSQRGGSVETHIRFGKEIYSPLVRQTGADLVISLEAQEALKAGQYSAENKTVFLIDNFLKPIFGTSQTLASQSIKKQLEKISKRVILIPATEIVKKEFNNPVLAGVYLLSFGVNKKLFPLKAETLLKAIKKVVPAKYFELNKKAFKLSA